MDLKNIFNLQLFADEGGEEGVNNPPVEPKTPAEPSTDPKNSVEDIEAEVNKRLETKLAEKLNEERLKWEKDYKKKAEHEKKEQERLSKLSEEERKKAEWERREAEITEREEALKLKEQQQEAISVLTSRGIPVAFMSFLVTDTDNDKNMENITTFEREMKKIVDEKVKEKLKGKVPSAGGFSNKGGKVSTKFNMVDIIKQNQVKR